MTDDQRPDPLPDASPQDDAGAEFLAAQDGEYQAAIERAYVEYVPDDEKLQKAKRRRITSRTIMAVLAVIAVLLTAGGIAGPQVVYAYEASRFTDIVRDVDATATQAEDLAALAEAEALLWELRSEESRDLPARLIALSQRPGEATPSPQSLLRLPTPSPRPWRPPQRLRSRFDSPRKRPKHGPLNCQTR